MRGLAALKHLRPRKGGVTCKEKRSRIHRMKVSGDAASADVEAYTSELKH